MGDNGVDLVHRRRGDACCTCFYARFWQQVLSILASSPPASRSTSWSTRIILGEDNSQDVEGLGNGVIPTTSSRNMARMRCASSRCSWGPLEQMKPWSSKGVEGVYGFLGRVGARHGRGPGRPVALVAPAKVTDAHVGRHAATPPRRHREGHRRHREVEIQHRHLRDDGARQRPDQAARSPGAPRSRRCCSALALRAAHAEELWRRLRHADTIAYKRGPSPTAYLVKNESRSSSRSAASCAASSSSRPAPRRSHRGRQRRELARLREWTAADGEEGHRRAGKLVNFVCAGIAGATIAA